jgi:hypothetical protein
LPLAAGRRRIKSGRGYSSMEATIARSHIKLWWGDLVISSRASRHPEEQARPMPRHALAGLVGACQIIAMSCLRAAQPS